MERLPRVVGGGGDVVDHDVGDLLEGHGLARLVQDGPVRRLVVQDRGHPHGEAVAPAAVLLGEAGEVGHVGIAGVDHARRRVGQCEINGRSLPWPGGNRDRPCLVPRLGIRRPARRRVRMVLGRMDPVQLGGKELRGSERVAQDPLHPR